MHTGMYLQNHRCVINGTPVDHNLDNWALGFRRAGYDPSLFGYTDTAIDPRGLHKDDPRLRHYTEPLPGMGDYTGYQQDVSIDWVNYLAGKGYEIPEVLWDLYGNKVAGQDWNEGGEVPLPLAINAEDHETHFMVDLCMDWIKNQDKPWITHLSLLRPHPPWSAPEPYNRLYDPASVTLPNRAGNAALDAEQHPLLAYFQTLSKFRAPECDREMRQEKANYYGLMSEVDDNLGRLFEFLQSTGEWDSTIVIFTSDHGEQLGDHWLKGKMGYFDSSYFVPLIIRDPRASADITRGQHLDVFTENVDLMPTLLECVDLEVPTQCDGHSLMPIVNTGQVPVGWRRAVHWEFDFRSVIDDTVEKRFDITAHQCNLAVIRDDRYKYVHFAALPPLFFDLKNDPHEMVNLANHIEYQPLVLEYAQEMLSWRMNHTHRGLTETYLSEAGPVVRRSPVKQVN